MTVCRQDTAEHIGQQPLPSGTWRPLKHLEMVTNGMKSPFLCSPCGRGSCWHQHCFLHPTALCLQASHSLSCFELLLSLLSIPMGCRTDFYRMITAFKKQKSKLMSRSGGGTCGRITVHVHPRSWGKPSEQGLMGVYVWYAELQM